MTVLTCAINLSFFDSADGEEYKLNWDSGLARPLSRAGTICRLLLIIKSIFTILTIC